ncbi:Hypothetical predicted protein [Mytilus galloprovincialis]|uniref:Uncharacterized protein n=1 Tax=Mytilus galloprovincialis TaxID=29158 RepID=A0A8B6GDE2_MYTGA|nr:Hypothetical predicted protein [Mytilus galloprovincialis]
MSHCASVTGGADSMERRYGFDGHRQDMADRLILPDNARVLPRKSQCNRFSDAVRHRDDIWQQFSPSSPKDNRFNHVVSAGKRPLVSVRTHFDLFAVLPWPEMSSRFIATLKHLLGRTLDSVSRNSQNPPENFAQLRKQIFSRNGQPFVNTLFDVLLIPHATRCRRSSNAEVVLQGIDMLNSEFCTRALLIIVPQKMVHIVYQ